MPNGGGADLRLERYAEAAAAHGRASATGDSPCADEAYDVMAAIYRELRAQGEEQSLLPLLRHADMAVVAWAGAHALEFAPREGERALQGVAHRDQGIVGFNAEQTLAVWREGKLSFP